MDNDAEILATLKAMHELLGLLAEPAIAARDGKRREELRRCVGNSRAKTKAVLLMDGSRTQTAIRKEIGIDHGQLSKFVKQLAVSGLLVDGESKEPKLALLIPANFFEESASE